MFSGCGRGTNTIQTTVSSDHSPDSPHSTVSLNQTEIGSQGLREHSRTVRNRAPMTNHDFTNQLNVHLSHMSEDPVVLSPRQQQIADLLLQGCGNTEISEVLKIKRHTVKAHFN